MVLPIISSLASVSSSISLISTGLTGISSIIGGLGSALAGVFSTGLLASVQFYEELKTNTESFLDDFVDMHVTAFGEIRERHEIMTGKLGKQLRALGFGSSETSSDSPGSGQAGGGLEPRKPASAYIPGYVAPTPAPSYGSAQLGTDLAAMAGSARNPLAGLESTLDGLRYLLENEGGIANAMMKKYSGDTNVTVNVHGGAMERRAAMAVGNIIAEEANRKTGTQQRATRYL